MCPVDVCIITQHRGQYITQHVLVHIHLLQAQPSESTKEVELTVPIP